MYFFRLNHNKTFLLFLLNNRLLCPKHFAFTLSSLYAFDDESCLLHIASHLPFGTVCGQYRLIFGIPIQQFEAVESPHFGLLVGRKSIEIAHVELRKPVRRSKIGKVFRDKKPVVYPYFCVPLCLVQRSKLVGSTVS